MNNEKIEKIVGTCVSIFGLGIMAGAAFVGWMDKRDRDAEKRRNIKRAKRLLNGFSSGPELAHQIDLIESRRSMEVAEWAYRNAKKEYEAVAGINENPKATEEVIPPQPEEAAAEE